MSYTKNHTAHPAGPTGRNSNGVSAHGNSVVGQIARGDDVRLLGFLVLINMAVLFAACSQGSVETASPAQNQLEAELYGALPPDLAELVAGDAANYWASCEDIWVTRNAGRNRQGHPHTYVMAGGLQLHHTGSFGDDADRSPIRIHVSSGLYRVYQSDDLPLRQPARAPGWSEWVALAAPELPAWTAHRTADGWALTFRPEAGEGDNERYALQYGAPVCASVPEG